MERATESLTLRVRGLDCDAEANQIRRGLAGHPGLVTLDVRPSSAKVVLTFDPAVTAPEQLAARLDALGFPTVEGEEMPGQPAPWRNPKVVASVASGLLLLAGWLLALGGGPSVAVVGLYVGSLVVGAWFFGREALEELFLEREVGIELLMLVAAVVASAMGEVGEGAMLAFLYSISEAAEGYTEGKTRSAIRALMDLAPKTARVLRPGAPGSPPVEVEVPIDELAVGDVFVVRPGESVATDGEVVAGASEVNQAPVTGESVPVPKGPGAPIFAGTLNEAGALEVRVTKTTADNTLARIIEMVEEAQERKGESHRFIERFGRRYSPAVLAVGLLLALVPPLAFGAAWAEWVARATVFVVAAAPCALVISVPITLVATLGRAARRGVLIKGGRHVEDLAGVEVVAFDKTGTLTLGEPDVTDVIAMGSVAGDGQGGAPTTEAALLAIAAGVERLSQHPLARAVLRRAEAAGVAPAPSEGFQSITGAGASARLDGRTVYVASPDFFARELGVPLVRAGGAVERLQEQGKTVVVVGTEGVAWGLLAIRDNVRPNARKALDALRRLGVRRLVMLTGDNARTAAAIAAEVGIDLISADLKPEDKVARVRELAREGPVAMVGDGVNDAPALAEATVGVAMGAAGTDVAMETADVVLMADDLEKLVYALELAKKNRRVVRQNVALSALVVGVLVVGAVLGAFTLPVAVIAHEVSEFVVIGSGLRMLRA